MDCDIRRVRLRLESQLAICPQIAVDGQAQFCAAEAAALVICLIDMRIEDFGFVQLVFD